MNFWENLFCGRLKTENEQLKIALADKDTSLAEAQEKIKTLEEDVKTLTSDYAELQDELGEALVKIKDLEADVAWYVNRVKGLEEALAASITIPDIAGLLDDTSGIVEPYQHPELGRVDSVTKKMIYDLEVGDLQYLTWSKDVWLAVIELIRPEVKKVLGIVKPEISDCENWAATMSNFIAHAFRNAGLDKQGAVFIAWSRKHAYNGFVDLDGKAWIFDPMFTEYLIGELGSTPEPMYKTTDIWFQ